MEHRAAAQRLRLHAVRNYANRVRSVAPAPFPWFYGSVVTIWRVSGLLALLAIGGWVFGVYTAAPPRAVDQAFHVVFYFTLAWVTATFTRARIAWKRRRSWIS